MLDANSAIAIKILSRRLKKRCKPQHCLGAPERFYYCWKRRFSFPLYYSHQNKLNLHANMIMALAQFKAKNDMTRKGGHFTTKWRAWREWCFVQGASMFFILYPATFFFAHRKDHYHSCKTF